MGNHASALRQSIFQCREPMKEVLGLDDALQFTTESGTLKKCSVTEELLIKNIYCEEALFQRLGKPFCIGKLKYLLKFS